MKKALSALICVTMLLSFFSIHFTAFADEVGELTVPKIEITTKDGNGAELQKADGYVNADIVITDTDGTTLEDSVSLKVRGHSTAIASIKKKAFTFKFSKKKNLFGMGSGKKWALLANTFDPTLMRNYIAFDFAKELDLPYTSNQKIVELWLDGKFWGCYLLIEPVQEGKDRVNIDIESDGGMKDFMLELEATRTESDTSYIKIDGNRFAISEPEEPTAEQLSYITQTVTDIVNVMKNGTKEEIGQKVDIQSFAKFYLLNEFLKTVDFNFSSVFFFYQNGKLYAGPPWDYDLSSGNSNPEYSAVALNASEAEGLYANEMNLCKYLCRYDWFYDIVKDVYFEHYDYIANISAEGGLMDEILATYGDVLRRNYTDAGWNVARYWVTVQKKPLKTYEENLDFLRNWYAMRTEWLTEYFNAEKPVVKVGDANNDGKVTAADVLMIRKHLASWKNLDINIKNADVNSDYKVTAADVLLIRKFLAGWDVEYFREDESGESLSDADLPQQTETDTTVVAE